MALELHAGPLVDALIFGNHNLAYLFEVPATHRYRLHALSFTWTETRPHAPSVGAAPVLRIRTQAGRRIAALYAPYAPPGPQPPGPDNEWHVSFTRRGVPTIRPKVGPSEPGRDVMQIQIPDLTLPPGGSILIAIAEIAHEGFDGFPWPDDFTCWLDRQD